MRIKCVLLGYVRNTEPLDARRTDFYSFQVQAEDCGGRVSEDATVHVQVNPVCRRGLSGLRLCIAIRTSASRCLAAFCRNVIREHCNYVNVHKNIHGFFDSGGFVRHTIYIVLSSKRVEILLNGREGSLKNKRGTSFLNKNQL